MNENPDKPTDEPKPSDTPPPRSGYEVDADGNVRGVWCTMKVDKFVQFTDEAITDPAELAKLRKPKPDA